MTNGIRFALSLGTPDGLVLANEIVGQSSIDPDIQLLRFKLLVSILNRDQTKAIDIWPQLRNIQPRLSKSNTETFLTFDFTEAKYEKDTSQSSDSWEEGFQMLEECIVAALQQEMDNEVVVHCLSAIRYELNKNKGRTSVLVRVARYVSLSTNFCYEKTCI